MLFVLNPSVVVTIMHDRIEIQNAVLSHSSVFQPLIGKV